MPAKKSGKKTAPARKAARPVSRPVGAKTKPPAQTTTVASKTRAPEPTGKPSPTKTVARAASRRGTRRPPPLRRGPNGELLAPGDLLLPGGAQRTEEIVYLFRGCVAAERPVTEEVVTEELTKRSAPEAIGEREGLTRTMVWARDRFARGHIEPTVPPRANLRRTFQGVVERARQRRREIGAFLRGLDLGRTETSHMDAHGEASLQSLMEWAARLENLAEAEEPRQADYNQFHRGLDQLETTTEALMIDVEQTLRRLRDRKGR
jgi:hypothetical protein